MESAQIERLLDVAKYILLVCGPLSPLFIMWAVWSEYEFYDEKSVWWARVIVSVCMITFIAAAIYRTYGWVKWGY